VSELRQRQNQQVADFLAASPAFSMVIDISSIPCLTVEYVSTNGRCSEVEPVANAREHFICAQWQANLQ
jgi:hypothetical protein